MLRAWVFLFDLLYTVPTGPYWEIKTCYRVCMMEPCGNDNEGKNTGSHWEILLLSLVSQLMWLRSLWQ